MDCILSYNFGYLPPRAGLTSNLPLSTLLSNKRGALSTDASPAKKSKTDVSVDTAALEKKCVNYIRVLCAEMVQNANSGHPGAPMGCAPMAHVLWNRIMKYDPQDAEWINAIVSSSPTGTRARFCTRCST